MGVWSIRSFSLSWALKYAQDKRTLRIDQIPMEDTKDYVQKVMNAYALFYEYDSTH